MQRLVRKGITINVLVRSYSIVGIGGISFATSSVHKKQDDWSMCHSDGEESARVLGPGLKLSHRSLQMNGSSSEKVRESRNDLCEVRYRRHSKKDFDFFDRALAEAIILMTILDINSSSVCKGEREDAAPWWSWIRS